MFIKKVVYRWSVNQCNHIIIGNKPFLNKLNEVLDNIITNKIIYIPPAIKGKEVTKKEIKKFRDQFNIKEKSIILLIQAFTATELKSKGAILTIKALKKIKEKVPGIILILTREGT